MDTRILGLDALEVGEQAQVVCLRAQGLLRRRLQDLGMTEGTRIEAVQVGPSGDPVAYSVRGTTLALRRRDAREIRVRRSDRT